MPDGRFRRAAGLSEPSPSGSPLSGRSAVRLRRLDLASDPPGLKLISSFLRTAEGAPAVRPG